MRLFKRKVISKNDQITPEYLTHNSRFKKSKHHSGTNKYHDYTEYYLYSKSRGLLLPISVSFRDNEIMIFGQFGAMIVFKKFQDQIKRFYNNVLEEIQEEVEVRVYEEKVEFYRKLANMSWKDRRKLLKSIK